MSNDTEDAILKTLIDRKKKTAFMPEYQDRASDAEALGLLIAGFFEWDGLRILQTAYAALEDSNYHSENEVIFRMIAHLTNPDGPSD